jgi:NADH:ubiquinone oxidoreductase subunit 3 (subunit A)
MTSLLLTPPVAFALLLVASGLIYTALRLFSSKNKQLSAGQKKPYSCGEEQSERVVRPDYSQFFPFAFFFTILHVVALTVATIPGVTTGVIFIGGLYLVGAVLGLFVLYRS